MSDTGVTVKKNQDFTEWYVEVVLKAELQITRQLKVA